MINCPKLKTTLASSGLLLPELTTLVAGSDWPPDFIFLRKLVIEDNMLSKPSIQSRKKIWEKLGDRYRFDAKDGLFCHWWDLIRFSEYHDLAQLAVLRWAQYDLLLRFLWINLYLPIKNAESPFQSKDLIYIIESHGGSQVLRRFFSNLSEKVQMRILQHFLLILKDCGGATGKVKKYFQSPPPGVNATRYAVQLARKEAPGSHEILDHWALRWWGDRASKADEILHCAESAARAI